MAAGPKIAGQSVGNSKFAANAIGAHNFGRSYYQHIGATGDVRAHYEDLSFSKAGAGGGEVIRARGIANAAGVAVGATINGAHITGRVASGATVGGALNGIRATLEVAGTNPVPGGTLAALNVDSNIVTGWTAGTNDAMIRVSQSGAGKVTNLFNFDAAVANHDVTTAIVMESAAYAASDLVRAVKCIVGGEVMYLVGTTTAPKA